MATYTLHLGFAWNSPPVGSIWDRGNVSGSYRFLQYALADSTPSPAWFSQFVVNDQLSVVVWDLSPSPQAMALGLDMSLGYLDSSKTYEPSSYLTMGTSAAGNTQGDQYYLSFSSVSGGPQSTTSTSPWGDCSSWYNAGSVTFSSAMHCKLSFLLTAVPTGGDGDPQVYVSDPEVIVGSMGRPT